jgi:hypothetical protein
MVKTAEASLMFCSWIVMMMGIRRQQGRTTSGWTRASGIKTMTMVARRCIRTILGLMRKVWVKMGMRSTYGNRKWRWMPCTTTVLVRICRTRRRWTPMTMIVTEWTGRPRLPRGTPWIVCMFRQGTLGLMRRMTITNAIMITMGTVNGLCDSTQRLVWGMTIMWRENVMYIIWIEDWVRKKGRRRIRVGVEIEITTTTRAVPPKREDVSCVVLKRKSNTCVQIRIVMV